MQIKHSHTSFIPSKQPVTHSSKHEQRHDMNSILTETLSMNQ